MAYLYVCECGGSSIESSTYRGEATTFNGCCCRDCGAVVNFFQPKPKDITPRKLTIKERLTGRVV